MLLIKRGLWTASKSTAFVKSLEPQERKILLKALTAVEDVNGTPTAIQVPSSKVLRSHCIHNGLPFIGFGFLDNLVMIVAGEYIDTSIGVTLCISTMAAAALGNTISDVFGIGSAWYVERIAGKIGSGPPSLSSDQLNLTPCRLAATLGRTVGIIIGCLLGMFPLLFFENNESDNK